MPQNSATPLSNEAASSRDALVRARWPASAALWARSWRP